MDEIEEVILALKAAGWAVPNYKILDTGVLYFDYRQQETSDTSVHSQQSGNNIS